jgi:ketosteroid isomerase-like protein
MANTKATTRSGVKIFCVLALSCAFAIPALAQDRKDDETRIVALEKAWNAAYRARDGRALGALLQDSVVLVDDEGRLQSRSEFLTGLTTENPASDQEGNPQSIKVEFYGNVAIATGVFRQSGFERGKAFIRQNRFVDTWIRNGNSWECVAASATRVLH